MLRDLLSRALIPGSIVVALATASGCKKDEPPPSPTPSASASAASAPSASTAKGPGVAAGAGPSGSAVAAASAPPDKSAGPALSAKGPAPIVPDSPLGIACRDYASARCAALDRCSHHLMAIGEGDVAACEATSLASCLSSMGLPESGWTPASIAACAKESRDLACDAFFHLPAAGACAPPKGKLALASTCISDDQCEGRFCVRASVLDACGKCATPPASGMACEKGRCAEGMACVSGKCAPRAEIGGACVGTGSSGSCQPWLSCVSGKCAAPASALDASCSILGEAPDCDGRLGLFCEIAAGKCKATTVAHKGETCASAQGELRVCAGGLLCRRAEGAAASACVPQPALGEACDPKMGLRCALPSRCLDGKCALPTMSVCK